MTTPAVLSWLPDQPCFVEARGMLLEGRGGIHWHQDRAAIVHARDDHLACAVGRVRWAAAAAALDQLPPGTELVVSEEDARRAGDWPYGWRVTPALVHQEPASVPALARACEVRLFTASDRPRLSHLPVPLREELEQALARSAMAVGFDDGLAVSFCYVGWETERWWDVSIDTLEGWRGRGFAAATASVLMQTMRARGKRAVWAALDTNEPSLRVARQLGFEPVGRVFVLTR